MSASDVYSIPIEDDDGPAPKDHRTVSPRAGVVTRQQSKTLSPQYSSTPTLSSSSSTSGNYSRNTDSDRTASPSSRNFNSRSTDSDPTASPSPRILRSRRPKGSSSIVNYDIRASGSRTYVSPASSPQVGTPQGADDDSDTQSERTPLMEGSVVDIQASAGSDDAQSDDDNHVEGFETFVKVLAFMGVGFVSFAGFLVFQSLWYKNVPNIPEGFLSNITEVIDTDANMD